MGTLSAFFIVLAVAAPPGDEAFFETRVRPVLSEKCVKCHGPTKSSGGLRLDSREAILKGGESGTAAVPGKAADSLLVKAIRRVKDVHAMPPDKPLDSAAIAALEKWIADGAVWPAASAPVRASSHWAFEPIRRVTPPAAANHPIDAFLVTKSDSVDRRTLLRRVTFDLIGLPPTPEETDDFLKDTSTDAFVKAIDRLLASRHYGEKWGRHWLDVVRYADTAGETADFPVPDAWRYRNYVIDAFNRDLPYDRFLREQIAGDILWRNDPTSVSSVVATGYLSISRRFGFDVLKDHFLTIEDTIDTVGKSVLGLTLGCARCHDHKYDPVSARDYYALYGIFESTRYPLPGCEKDKFQRELVPLITTAEALPRVPAALMSLSAPTRGWGEIANQIVRPFPSTPTAYAVWEGQAHDAELHKRGDPDVRGEVVPRRFLTVLGGQPLPANAGSGRLALADWLVDPKNPLTARVMVNRVWQGHFGVGLVATLNDFGTRGAPPTHPELLDWLASELMRSGWSIKAMHRLIVTSAAYQGVSRHRLAAEEIRDALLAVSGDLDPSPGGPHPFPEAKTWGFTQHAPFKAVYETNRRSVYLMTQRIQRHPFLALFDGPDPNASTAGRQTTTVPTQALYFLNDPFVHARAASLAKRLEAIPDQRQRLDRACQLLYCRPATDRDWQVAGRFLKDGDWPAWLRVMMCSNEFVYVD